MSALTRLSLGPIEIEASTCSPLSMFCPSSCLPLFVRALVLAQPSFLNPKSRLYDLVQSSLRSPDLAKLWWVDQAKVVQQLDELTQEVREDQAASMSTQDREAYYAKLLAADIKFLSLLSYVSLQKSFQVK
jgi:hypothetical protein